MSSQVKNSKSDEINFSQIFLHLWKQKFLILSLSFTFLIAGFVYGMIQPKIYKTNATLRVAPENLFFKYSLYLQKNFEQIFEKELKLNLLSSDNLIEFVEKNNQINEFKSTLKKKNIDASEYFKKKFNLEGNKYTLRFEKILPGEDFLNDYIIFTKQKTEAIFIEQLISTLDSQINYYKQNLKIAEKIDLQDPIFKSNPSVENEPQKLFYEGTKVLSHKIIYLNELKNDAINFKLNYNPFVEKASSSDLISKSTLVFVVAGFIVGLFISLIIIFIRA